MISGLVRSGSMKMKLLIYLTLLSSVPVALMGWFSAAYSGRTITKQTYQMNASALRSLENEMNGEFRKLDNLMLQYSFQYSAFLPYVRKDLSYTNYAMVWDLNNILTNLRSGLEHVAEVDFYNIPYGKILTSSGLILSEDEFQDPKVLEQARTAAHGTWINTRKDINARLQGDLLAYTRPVQDKQTSKVEGVVIVYLNAASVSRSLLSSGGTGTEYLVLDRSGTTMLDSDPSRIGQSLKGTELFRRLAAGEQASSWEFRDKVRGVQSLVNVRYSDYRDWYYVSAVPLKLLTAPSDRLTYMLWSISLGLILLALILAVAASQSLYSPIQRLTKRIFGTSSWNGANELGSIASYIESVEKDNRTLQQDIRTYMEDAKTYAVFQLLLGNVKNQHDPQLLDFGEGTVALYLIELDRLYLDRHYSRNDRFLYYFAVQNMTDELLREDGKLKIIMVRPGLIAVILETEGGQDSRALRERATRLLEAIRSYLKLPCVISASYAAGGLQGLGDAYADGTKALRYSFVYGHNQVILCNELDPSVSAEAEELDACETEMVLALQADDIDGAEQQFKQLLDLIRDHYSLSPEEMFGYFASLSGRLWNAAAKQLGKMQGEGLMQEWILNLARLRTLQEVEVCMQEGLFGRIRQANREAKTSGEEQTIAAVTAYIRSHYDRDLSLQLCADVVGLNPFQLSRMFKKVMGVNFVDYVIGYRIGIAKELLADPDVKILEISDKLRYGSVKSFIRLFKKVTGLTPGAYRKQILQLPE
ncbi:AraC family transcriptional regulator [Gorillibacterium sp. sgz5001074]|uniref:AraC family transcriptional regulator n=1 Tax=Gorillibacterium sp. sgz5001074 TaxID=3446695 RepID=UPI003F6636A2